MSARVYKFGKGSVLARKTESVAPTVGRRALWLLAVASTFVIPACIGGQAGEGNRGSGARDGGARNGFEIQLNNDLQVKVQLVAETENAGSAVLGTVGPGEQRRFIETPAGEALDSTGTFVVLVSERCVGTEYGRRRGESGVLQWTLATPLDELFDLCSDGSCVPRGQGCQAECTLGELPCGQYCIPPDQRCDGFADCDDGSDELTGCDVGGPSAPARPQDRVGGEQGALLAPHIDPGLCAPGEVPCDEGCVPAFHWCDGIAHCPQGEDELPGCQRDPACGEDELHCGDGLCQPLDWGCDDTVDCATGLDEPSACSSCPADRFPCEDGSCVAASARCDGVVDCPAGADEPLTCADERCGENFLCGDGSCVPSVWQCDGRSDCLGGEDEEGCGACPGRFECPEGSCLPFTSVCDGRADCVGGTDEAEQLCEVGLCQSGEVSCGAGSCCPDAFPICCPNGETCGRDAADCG